MAWFLMITNHTALTCSVRLACPSNLRTVDPWFQICLREMQYLNLQFSKIFLHFQQLIWLLQVEQVVQKIYFLVFSLVMNLYRFKYIFKR